MSAKGRIYLDTSALAKWYLNETGSINFSSYIQQVEIAVISSLTQTEIRSLLARRRRMGEITHELESIIFASFLEDIMEGSLLLYPIENARFDEALNLIARYPEHPLRTLDALHLAVARHHELDGIATADAVMAATATSMGFQVACF